MMDLICFHSFFEEKHSAILLNLSGDPLIISSSRGATIEQVRDLLRLDPNSAIVGVCGCGRHYKDVREGAFVPYGSTLIQWSNPRRQKTRHLTK